VVGPVLLGLLGDSRRSKTRTTGHLYMLVGEEVGWGTRRIIGVQRPYLKETDINKRKIKTLSLGGKNELSAEFFHRSKRAPHRSFSGILNRRKRELTSTLLGNTQFSILLRGFLSVKGRASTASTLMTTIKRTFKRNQMGV